MFLNVIAFILYNVLPVLMLLALFVFFFWAGKEVGKMQEYTKNLSKDLEKLNRDVEALNANN